MTTTPTEVLPPEGKSIVLAVPEGQNIAPSLLSNIEAGFKDAFAKAEEWRTKALAISVKSADDKGGMKMARLVRLELKNIRVAADHTRKSMKEDFTRANNAIQGVYNILLASLVPLEKHLEEQEQYGERLLEEQRQALIADRHEKLKPFLKEGQPLPPLDGMTEDQFTAFLADMHTLHEAHIASEKRIEAERIAREAAEAAEKERLRLENERLVKEAAEREAAAKAEREAAEKAQRAAAEKARKEREALEAKAKAEREAAEKELAQQKAAAAEAQRVADEAARKERAAIQAKADAERNAAAAQAAAERAAREKVERELEQRRLADEAKAKAEAAAAKKAAAAPDKVKILAIAAAVRKLDVPTVTTPEGKAVLAEVTAKIESFAKWIETQASNL